MSDFLHYVAEGLRSREKYLEDHNEHPVFDLENGSTFRQEYETLLADVRAFSHRIDNLQKAKKDFDEHFEGEIRSTNEKISIEIDTWFRKLPYSN